MTAHTRQQAIRTVSEGLNARLGARSSEVVDRWARDAGPDQPAIAETWREIGLAIRKLRAKR